MRTLRDAFVWAVLAAMVSVNWAVSAEADKKDGPQPDADGWYSLFNGQDFEGWKKSTDHPDTFQVVNGEIVVKGPRCHLFYTGPVCNADFKNFEWSCDVLTKPHANSGMYFHTKYLADNWPDVGIEVQVNNTHGDRIKTGSLYQIKNVMDKSAAKDDEWFTQTVVVKGKQVTVKVNGKVVNEYTQEDPPKREKGWEKRIVDHGTFALQGHDPGSEIHYKNIKVKPLP